MGPAWPAQIGILPNGNDRPWLIFSPFGYFKGKPAEGSEANAPEESHVHHHLHFYAAS